VCCHLVNDIALWDTRTKICIGPLVFWSDSAENIIKNIFDILHHKIINDKSVVWMNDVSLLAIAFIIYA